MTLSHSEIKEMLSLGEIEAEGLFARATAVREQVCGKFIYLRGLVEYSNSCRKNCFYCGIRREMPDIDRYTLSDDEVLDAARFAMLHGYGSVVLQAGESTSRSYTDRITSLIRRIREITPASVGLTDEQTRGWDTSLGVTLSLGEQSPETLREWFAAGASRYLLRIEASDPGLYASIHPRGALHSYDRRRKALEDLRDAGFAVGTGVMIGLPGQTMDHLAADLLFMQREQIDMCGMGPYIDCAGTPMAGCELPSGKDRIYLTLKMIAVLRLLMPDINIAAATALETLDPQGRIKALAAGANVVMPNITPGAAARGYRLYDNKPLPGVLDTENLGFCRGKAGDPLHYKLRRS